MSYEGVNVRESKDESVYRVLLIQNGKSIKEISPDDKMLSCWINADKFIVNNKGYLKEQIVFDDDLKQIRIAVQTINNNCNPNYKKKEE